MRTDCRLAALGVVALALAWPQGAAADPAAELVGLINDYRRAPPACAGRRFPTAPPLAPSDRLAGIAPASGSELGAALGASGYPVSAATSIRLMGPADPAAALRFVAGRHCADLLDLRYSEIGVTRVSDNAWRINLARPLLPASLGDWRRAGHSILDLVNEARARPRQCGGQRFAAARPLVWNEALGAAALTHSRDMADRDYFSHADPEGRSVSRRATAVGYRWQVVGENIAAGVGEPAAVVAGWLESPGHCVNIMSPDFAEMGAAFAVRIGTARSVWWTQTFGRR
ncbi:MAG: CAP domain-containing protein [Caldimonas sp.]